MSEDHDIMLTAPPRGDIWNRTAASLWRAAGDARLPRSLHRPSCAELEGASFALLVVAFCLTLLFLYFWGQAENDYNDFDWFNFVHLGFWFPWSVVLLVISAGFFTYVTVLMLLAVCLLSEGQKLHLHWSHKVTAPSSVK
ncbi:hypothetical protein ATANTOWER_021051 [Ataeniobius toweri]|uniref:Uncharacterized protein n=1 Tax=Ataeniobius toweri TaxID=208326 RepID=A0ABU7BH87_9TELE|nr:hypothetical protein [Ataeniobius toweri]